MTEFRRFDHSELAAFAEYRDVARAVDALLHKMHREDVVMSEPGFERVLADIARHMCASDCCDQCMNAGDFKAHAPIAGEQTPTGGIKGAYVCESGHQWTCYWGNRELAALLP